MIIPVRCFTCGKVIANKWNYYVKRKIEKEEESVNTKVKAAGPNDSNPVMKYFQGVAMGDVLDELSIDRMCCRRMMISHVDLIE